MTRNIQILFILPDLNGGGAQRVMLTVLSHLDRGKFTPTLALASSGGPFLDRVPSDVNVVELGAARTRSAVFGMTGLVCNLKPQIVVSTLGHLNLILGMIKPLFPRTSKIIARETNIPSINNRNQPYPRFFDLLYRILYPRFDAIICQSRDMQCDLVDNYNINIAKIPVIHNPVDIDWVQKEARSQIAIEWPQGEGARLLAAGKLTPQKGFDLLLQALAKLDLAWKMVILGEGPERGNLEHLAEQLGISSKVSFQGFSANPYAWMRTADLFVLSSRHEGFPNVLLEAGALGLPMAAFACPGGIDEIVKDGINGFLAKAEDVKAFSRVIHRCLTTQFDSHTIIGFTREHYSAQDIVRKYEQVFLGI